MMMNDDGGTFCRAWYFQAKQGARVLDGSHLSCGFGPASLVVAGDDLPWQRSQEGSLRGLFTTESTFVMYSRSSDMNCKVYDQRVKERLRKECRRLF